MPRAKRQHGSLDEAIKGGCIMSEYHRHETNENFTVHVKGADGQMYVYTNIGQEHMKKLLEMVGIKEAAPKDHWVSPEYEAFEQGESEQAGTEPAQGRTTRASTAGGGAKSTATLEGPARTPQGGVTFVESVRQGGKLVDYHLTDRGTYAVHIETPDGVRRAYSSVSREHMENLEGFEGD